MSRHIYHIIFLMTAALLWCGCLSAQQPQALQCEQRVDPEGIDVQRPRLSWMLAAGGGGIKQTAYQLLVASSAEVLSKDKGDLWNSGKVSSGESRMIGYAGVALGSRGSCYWKVKVWTTTGESPWSHPAKWSMGLLHSGDWKARWIGYE